MSYEINASALTTLEAKEKFNMHGFLVVRGLFSADLMKKNNIRSKIAQ